MAQLIAYLDKAGDANESVIVVAGFVAGASAWGPAGEEWKQETHCDNFHMSDQKPVEKDAVLPKLVEIARRHLAVPVAAGVRTRAFEGAKEHLGAVGDWIADPYRLCCLNCLIAASEWAKDRDVGPVDFVFDKDGKLGSRALDLYRLAANFPSLTGKFKVGSITRSDRRRTRGIQLADALAHALFSFNREVIQNPHLRMGPLLTELTKDIQGNWLFTRPEEVERWAQELASAVGGNGHSMQLVGGPAA